MVEGTKTEKPKDPWAEVQLNTSVRGPIFLAALIMGVALGGFAFWAVRAPLDQGIVSQGIVNIAGHRKAVQHLRGGVVKEILIKNGDYVRAGDPLIRLDEVQVKTELGQLRSQYLAVRANEARLFAERDDKNSIKFSGELISAKEESAAEFMRAQRELFITRRKTMASEVAIYQESIAALSEQLEGVRNLEKGKAHQISLYEEQIQSMRALIEKGYVARVQIFDLERALAGVIGSRGEDLGNIARLQKNIGETKLKILYIRQTQLKEIQTQLEQLQRELASLKERLIAAEDAVKRVVITSPAEGHVMGLNVYTQGGVIQSGVELMSIVPVGASLILDVQIQPKDIDSVHVGLKATVRLTALNRNTTPTIDGTVTTVSADRFVDSHGTAYYAAQVAITNESMEKIGDLRIQPGMPADVIIRTGERTLMEYLFKPIADRFALALKE